MTADSQASQTSLSRISGIRDAVGRASSSEKAKRDWRVSDADRSGLVRLAHRFVWSVDDAEDVVQEALLAAQSRRDQLRDPDRFVGWVRRIVVHKALVHIRRGRTRERPSESGVRTASDPGPGPVERASQRDEIVKLRGAIERLPSQQRAAITLRHLEGMGYSEIADIMEIAESTVRFHVRAARVALAEMMGTEG